VITGASGGVGRATAHAFAQRGPALVLVARSAEALRETMSECQVARRRGRGRWPRTSPTPARCVAALARERFGGLHVWVNNAGIGAIGRFH
jgi:short-subunit dehydrogenase